MLLATLLRDLVPFVLLHLSQAWQLVCSTIWRQSSQERRKPGAPPPSSEDVRWAEHRFAELTAISHKEPGDTGTTEKPPWLDQARIARARELHRLFWPLINNAQVMSLFLSFTLSDSVRPLLWTGKSHTVRLARARYVQTALFTHSWALGDIWNPDDPACQNAERVRTMHVTVARRLEGRNLSGITVPEGAPPPREPSRLPALQADVAPLLAAALWPAPDITQQAVTSGCPAGYGTGAQPLSQRGMVDTQWFFVGLLILHPEKYGLGHLSEEDWDCFLHLWRSIGRRLGVADRYNLCAGSVSQVRELCRLIERRVMIPHLVGADPLWHPMTQALYDGLGTVFSQCCYEAWLYYLVSEVLGLPAPRLRGTLSWTGLWKFHMMRLTFRTANNNLGIHAGIRALIKREFQTAATEERLEPHLTYVFNLI